MVYPIMDQNSKKVYVNPNFTNVPNNILQQKNVMHINPLFTYQNRQVQQNRAKSISKIYVNRNFIASKNNQNVGIIRDPAFENINTTNPSLIWPKQPNQIVHQNIIKTEKPESAPVSTSRYSLVRYNNIISENQNKTIPKLTEKVTNTVRVNKYKTVQVEAIKKNLNTIKSSSIASSSKEIVIKNHIETQRNPLQNVKNFTKSSYRFIKNDINISLISDKLANKTKVSRRVSNNESLIYKYKLTNNASFKNIYLNSTPKQNNSYKIHNRFKLVKQNTASVESCSYGSHRNRRLSFILKKKEQKLLSPAKINLSVTKFNKNNIPCPLFRKYGKCIRNIKGHCKFVHDKKHVSICRKFIKGICHDEGCLLSHDVTSKKMPTCYFYLQGMCMKEKCPYLHVKLNEKTQICADFLKGFCEKGENCLHRHINVCPDLAIKGICLRKTCPYSHKSKHKYKLQDSRRETKKIKNKKIDRESKQITHQCNTKNNEFIKTTGQEIHVVEGRYYRDSITDNMVNEECEFIPSRCKLGILPSFIQL